MNYLDFEEKVAILESKISDLKELENQSVNVDVNQEISQLQKKCNTLLGDIYSKLTAWQKVQVARHPDRPHTVNYIDSMIDNFVPLQGDRLYAEDRAIIAGLGSINDKTVMVIGVEKGHNLETRMEHNFGMAKPEGYRKAQRLMKLADKLNIPIITLVDTAGAYPGQEAEERGQGEAIARSIATCLEVKTPMVSVIIGEGGSGGAIALSAADYVMMLEHSVYSVISPEGCASILWRNDQMAKEASERLGLTASNLKKLGIVDEVIEEPVGGAHRHPDVCIAAVKNSIIKAIDKLENLEVKQRKLRKQEKYLSIGRLKDK